MEVRIVSDVLVIVDGSIEDDSKHFLIRGCRPMMIGVIRSWMSRETLHHKHPEQREIVKRDGVNGMLRRISHSFTHS